MLAVLMLGMATVSAQDIEVLSARVSTTPDRARVVFDLSAASAFSVLAFNDPRRLVVDVRATALTQLLPDNLAGQGLVESFTLGPSGEGAVRAELTLNDAVTVQQAYFLDPFDDQPARLVVDLIAATDDAFDELVVATTRALGDEAPLPAFDPTPPGESALDYSSRPLIVLDPGHGGLDGGAQSSNGIAEKQVVLAFAGRLQDLLIATGRFDVALTRNEDIFVPLESRVAMARQNRASLFISIHADSFNQSEIRGAAVYVRGEQPTDTQDGQFATRENLVDLLAGLAPPDAPLSVVSILSDLMRRETRRLSHMAAGALVDQMEPSVELRGTALRQADFVVLAAPEVPSVLLELGFLSNADDNTNMTALEWQDRMAEAAARGIASYFDLFAVP
jgi:N-acetylmuramoyl-L-alanine amidase